MRIAVTGLGAVTALGPTRESTWQRLIAGDSGIKEIRALELAGLLSALALRSGDRIGILQGGEEKDPRPDHVSHYQGGGNPEAYLPRCGARGFFHQSLLHVQKRAVTG